MDCGFSRADDDDAMCDDEEGEDDWIDWDATCGDTESKEEVPVR